MKEIREKILLLLKNKSVSLRFLSAEVGMSATGLNRTLKDETLKVSVLIKIADFFEVPINYFFQDIEFDPKSIKFKKSTILSALESGVVKISVEPILIDIIKNELEDDTTVQRSFMLMSPTSFYDHFDKFLTEDFTDANENLKVAKEHSRIINDHYEAIVFALLDLLMKRDIIKDLNNLNLTNMYDLHNEIKKFVEKLKSERMLFHKALNNDDHNMTSD